MMMKPIRIYVLVAAATALLCPRAIPQEAGKTEAEKMQAMMKKWIEHIQPDEHHKRLARFVGSWKVEGKMWMGGGAPVTKTQGTAEFSWAIPGRWLLQKFTGTMMNMPVQGMGISGWDKTKKKHVATWVDNMGTAISHMEGVVVDPTHKLTALYGTIDEFLTGEHDKMAKWVTRWIDADKFEFEIWDMGIGVSGAKVVWMTYTRKQ